MAVGALVATEVVVVLVLVDSEDEGAGIEILKLSDNQASV